MDEGFYLLVNDVIFWKLVNYYFLRLNVMLRKIVDFF